MEKPSVYIASDYAGVDYGDSSFYYGYEHSICTTCGKKNKEGSEYCQDCEGDNDREWCFVATVKGKETVIKFSELGVRDMFDVVTCLISGMAIERSNVDVLTLRKG